MSLRPVSCTHALTAAGDRGQPSCGWCVRNHQLCEYKERKKPGLRAGYGRELEARLGERQSPRRPMQGTHTQALQIASRT